MNELLISLQFVIVSGLLLALLVGAVLAVAQRPLLAAMKREAPLQRVHFARGVLLAPAALGLAYAALSFVVPRWLAAVPAVQTACHAHDDALWHACFWHPTEGGSSSELWVALGLVGLLLGALLVAWVWRLLRDLELLRTLLRLATPEPRRAEVHVVDVDEPLALACGLTNSRILLSRFLMNRLQPRQIEIIVEHEAAHVRHHDLLWRLIARGASFLHWPALRRRLLRQHDLATEQRCDIAASRAVGSELDVAETILAVERLMRPRAPSSEPALAFGDRFIPERIDALLHPQPASSPTVRIAVALLLLATSASSTAGLHAAAERLITWVAA